VNVTDVGLMYLATSVPRDLLTLKLTLSFNRTLSVVGISALAQSIPPTLRSLRLACSGCLSVDDDALKSLAASLPPQLRHLKFFFALCRSITDDGIEQLTEALPSTLRTLTLSFEGCSNINSARPLISRLRQLPHLREVVTNFRNTGVSDDCMDELNSWEPSADAQHFKLQDKDRLVSTLGCAALAKQLEDLACGFDTKHLVFSIFRSWDQDGNGTISMSELQRVFRKLNPDMTSEELATIFRAADTNTDGVIDMDEFTTWLFE